MRNSDVFFKLNTIQNRTAISFDLYESKGYDKISCESLKLDTPWFIVPIVVEKVDDVINIEYKLPNNYLSVKDYTNTMTIEQIFSLYNKVYTYIDECREWYLIPEGFCFDARYVYLDEKAENILLLYIPDLAQNMNYNNIKELFIDILEKCEEESGDKIQLQLYKYFYKQDFDLNNFRSILNKYKEEDYVKIVDMDENTQITLPTDGIQENNSVIYKKKDPAIDINFMPDLQMDNILTDIEREFENDKLVNSSEDKLFDLKKVNDEKFQEQYYDKEPDNQISEEEIDSMINRICDINTRSSNKQYELSKSESSVEDRNKVSLNDILFESADDDKNFNNNTDQMLNENVEGSAKKRNMLDNVFGSSKSNKKSERVSQTTKKNAVLLVVGSHPRYDLPKSIKVEFRNEKFVIGRAAKIGEDSGATYEFGEQITPISQIHAQIERCEDEFLLSDLDSSNGTFLNGVKLQANKQYVLKNGDKIAFAIAFSKNSIEYIFRV